MRLFTTIFLILVASTVFAQEKHALPFMPPASNESLQGFVRVINLSDRAGSVNIHAIDDTGQRFGPITWSIEANETTYFNSQDLERGNLSKGLSDGVGDGEGNWRLELDTPLDIQPLAYLRTPDGFVTSMHDVVPEGEEGAYHVPFFNPGSNRRRSLLRVINPAHEDVQVTISGVDDDGEPSAGDVTLMLQAGTAQTMSAAELEEGDTGFDGSLGDGEGKWRLSVTADGPLWVMNLLYGLTGHLTNLSTDAPKLAIPPEPKPEPVMEGIGGTSSGSSSSTRIVNGRLTQETTRYITFNDWGFHAKQGGETLFRAFLRGQFRETNGVFSDSVRAHLEGTVSGDNPTSGNTWVGQLRATTATGIAGTKVTGIVSVSLSLSGETINVSATNLTAGYSSLLWENLPVVDGRFQDANNTIDGAFYGEAHDGVAIKIERQGLRGVMGALRE